MIRDSITREKRRRKREKRKRREQRAWNYLLLSL